MNIRSAAFAILAVFSVAPVSEAEISFDAARKLKLNDPKESYEKSLDIYDRAYVGSFKFNSVRLREDKPESLLQAEFVVDRTLKGGSEFNRFSVVESGIRGCVTKGDRSVLLSKMEKVAVAEGQAAIKEMDSLIEQLGGKQSDCDQFIAIRMIQGNIDEIYKSRYELIFENIPYVLFVSRYSISKAAKITGVNDVMVYDKSFVQPAK